MFFSLSELKANRIIFSFPKSENACFSIDWIIITHTDSLTHKHEEEKLILSASDSIRHVLLIRSFIYK